MVGAAAAALSHASHWATTRVQFNAPIGSLQAVQHRLADAFIDVVTAQDSVYDAAGSIDRGAEARGKAAEAKAYCSDACRRVDGGRASDLRRRGDLRRPARSPLAPAGRRPGARAGLVRFLRGIVADVVLSD